jgi:hypothetical protein
MENELYVKSNKPNCPVCYSNDHVISDGNGSANGRLSFNKSDKLMVISECNNESFYYCTNCFVDFSVLIKYKKYNKDKRIGVTGRTGCQG